MDVWRTMQHARPIWRLTWKGGQLSATLAPLASDTVTTILGFTEISGTGQPFSSAAVFHKGAVVGVYRKLYPAIRKSIYQPGDRSPVFRVGSLTFGIVICNDSNYPEPARIMAAQGATALFVPTNNGLPPEKADVVTDARNADIALARANRVSVIRADVAGWTGDRVSYGSSGIVDHDGTILHSAQRLTEDLLVADLDTPDVTTLGPGAPRAQRGEPSNNICSRRRPVRS